DPRSAADEIGRARQNLQRGPSAFERRLEARILRPDGVLGPDIGSVGAGCFVAVVQALRRGTRVYAEMRVDVDDTGRHPAALRGDDVRAGGGAPTPPPPRRT